MGHRSYLLEVPLSIMFVLSATSAGKHSLQFIQTVVTPGTNFPEFTAVVLMDGEQIVYYDSNIRTLIPKTEWMKKIKDDQTDYWTQETERMEHDQYDLIGNLNTIKEHFNQNEGVHTLLVMYGCELSDDNTTNGYDQYGYDGEDFLSLDLKTLIWTAANDHTVISKLKWNNEGYSKKEQDCLQITCIEWLPMFVSYGGETLARKDPPEVSVFHKRSSSSELVCHATGFFPRGLMMFWQKDGEELHEDVDDRETLPNQDGTFQKRAVLRVSPEELKEHEYTCVVQHSSLEKDLVLPVPDPDALIWIIVGAVIVLALIAGVLIWKFSNTTESN
ncbi:BOLA class I histocompatibility antigen, alpha chain BL3-6-like [Trichomycterus rosablanca]|uniref:BOLA class I histocompatibility antigen, alpha chain BL3-6-like n=1 Tax=Trichomycterus rosablanca TaxID=2290929 RepID=UPI002F3539D1